MDARQTYQRMQAARRLLVAALAGAGVLLWLSAFWPAQRVTLQALAIPFSIMILPAVIVCAIRESIWHRRCEQHHQPWAN